MGNGRRERRREGKEGRKEFKAKGRKCPTMAKAGPAEITQTSSNKNRQNSGHGDKRTVIQSTEVRKLKFCGHGLRSKVMIWLIA
jgi:hypothetical protein